MEGPRDSLGAGEVQGTAASQTRNLQKATGQEGMAGHGAGRLLSIASLPPAVTGRLSGERHFGGDGGGPRKVVKKKEGKYGAIRTFNILRERNWLFRR